MNRLVLGQALAIAIVLGSAALTSCGGGDDDADATNGESPARDGGSSLGDGEHFVFVRRFDSELLVVDPAEFLGGEAATAAAREDGVIGRDETMPNDFYIRNPSRDDVLVELGPNAELVLLAYRDGIEELAVSLEDLQALLAGEADPGAYDGIVPGELPVRLVIEQGLVTRLTQQYHP